MKYNAVISCTFFLLLSIEASGQIKNPVNIVEIYSTYIKGLSYQYPYGIKSNYVKKNYFSKISVRKRSVYNQLSKMTKKENVSVDTNRKRFYDCRILLEFVKGGDTVKSVAITGSKEIFVKREDKYEYFGKNETLMCFLKRNFRFIIGVEYVEGCYHKD